MAEPNRNRKLFIFIFIGFTLLMAMLALDMARRTTAPWNKPKQLERALPGALPPADNSLLDSLLREEKEPTPDTLRPK
ncbi:hypothetical protein GCM10027275_44130 [Rhabdobacter roseus]|uniref:Uncharacterized protein n=1 Tax=Rhabdobacter roseus TaxID=1655419 RepID=A0A840U332_9BACT|nr:hypothetical protein [Rhabdobacter roseus]MBB5286530.1 hypothetical protein [Rhabdobacter roseus]